MALLQNPLANLALGLASLRQPGILNDVYKMQLANQQAQQQQQQQEALNRGIGLLTTPQFGGSANYGMTPQDIQQQAAGEFMRGGQLKAGLGLLGLGQQQGQLPALVQEMQMYKALHPEYKGDIVDFQGKMRMAGQPETTPGSIKAYGTSIQMGNATLRNVPIKDRADVAKWLEDQGPNAYSPEAKAKLTRSASMIMANFEKLPQFQLTANGLPYLQRIDAAIKTPGSVSDNDLLDSMVKLNTGGQAITEAQVSTITKGRSFSDAMNIWRNKLNTGGVLSNDQRNQIQKIAKAIYHKYQAGYQPVYDRLTKQLKDAGIPEQFWSLPDLNKLSEEAGYPMLGTQTPSMNIGRFKVEVQ